MLRGGTIVKREEEAVVEEGEEVGHGRGVVQLRPQDLKHGACAETIDGVKCQPAYKHINNTVRI